MAGETQQGTIWAQYVRAVWAAPGPYTVQISMNHRHITAYSSMREFGFVIPGHHHPWGQSVPPQLFGGWTGISAVTAGGHHTSFNPRKGYIKAADVTEIWFETFDCEAVHVINYWNTAVVFSP
jgi:hypothetical protein